LRYFLTLEDKDEMTIDQNQDQKYLNITMDLTFTALPCSALGMNLMDPKKANVMHVNHQIYKTRISKTGKVLGQQIRDSLTNVATPFELGDAFHRYCVESEPFHVSLALCFLLSEPHG